MREWSNYVPTELSGGQQQRISLARALVVEPEIIIADEPTGNLDYEAGQKLMSLLSDLNTKLGKTIIMVTHDLEYLTYAKTIVNLFDGKVKNIYQGNDIKKIISTIKTKKGFFADVDDKE
jgi:putative ABC transport system ATP-binding protein